MIRSTKLDCELAERIQSCNEAADYDAIIGGTMSTDDFYEGLFYLYLNRVCLC